MANTKIPVELSSTPSIVDGGNATAITIDSDENILVNTTNALPYNSNSGTTADNAFVVNNTFGFTAASAYNNSPLLLNRTSTDGAIIALRKDGTAVGSIGTTSSDLTIFSSTSGHVGLQFGNTRLHPTGNTGSTTDGVADLGFSTTRWKDLYLSGGAYLGGTGAANKLDDYEEGTWTPILSFGGGTTGIGYGQQNGTYTKIGNIVCANFTIVLNSKGSSGGAAVVSALPYAVGFANHAFFIYSDRVTFTGGIVAGYINSGTSIKLYNQVSGSNSALSNSEFANNSYISGVFTYTTNG